jgi:hypothetical protein
MTVKPDEIRELLTAHEHLTGEAARWLDGATERVAAAGEAIRSLFPAVGRHCGRVGLDAPAGWTVDDAVRVLLLIALPLSGRALADEVAGLYWYGDAAEKRGVLRGLPLLDLDDAADTAAADVLLPLLHDALRTNDTRLVAAALGPYGAAHLDAAAYRQAVLKCVFMGVPLAEISGLPERRDAELVRMFADFAQERIAAGRPVPDDVWLVTRHPEDPEEI